MLAQELHFINFDSIEDAYESLPEKEKEILSRYFGFYGREQESLEDIGNVLGLTLERVRQIKERSLEKIAKSTDVIGYKSKSRREYR